MNNSRNSRGVIAALVPLILLLSTWGAFNCGLDGSSQDGGVDAGKPCNSNAQCGAGETCVNRQCVPKHDDGGSGDGPAGDGSLPDGGAGDGGTTDDSGYDGGTVSDGGPADSGTGDGGSGDGGVKCSSSGQCPQGNRCSLPEGICEPGAIIQVEPADLLDFGAVVPGASVVKGVAIENKGLLTLRILGLELQNPADNPCFEILSGGGAADLVPGQKQDVVIRYTQADDLADYGKLLIQSSDKDRPFYNVNMKSTYGGRPDFLIVVYDSVSQQWIADYPMVGDGYEYPVDFGFVSLGNAKRKVVGLRNVTDGDAYLALKDFAPAGAPSKNPFTVEFRGGPDPDDVLLGTPSQGESPLHLYAGAGETVYLHAIYDAQTKQDTDGRDFTLVTNDGDINNSGEAGHDALTIKMTARARPLKIEVSPLSLEFKDVQKGNFAKKAVTISNAGGTELNVLASSGLKFTADTHFSHEPASLQKTLEAKGSFVVEVSFTPKSAVSEENFLVINSDDAEMPVVEVALSGMGTDPDLSVATVPAYAGNPPLCDLGRVIAGQKAVAKVTVTNSGKGGMLLSSLVLNQGGGVSWSMKNIKLNGAARTPPVTLRELGADSLTFDIEFFQTEIGVSNAAVTFKNSDLDHVDFFILLKGAAVHETGHDCQADAECDSGFCTDGVCCGERCGEKCRSCGQEGQKGVCALVPAGTADPRGVCKYSAPDTCGETGKCDSGNCAQWTSATVCAAAQCIGNARAKAEKYCSGDGSKVCVDSAETDCTPYACDPSFTVPACRTACTSAFDCAGGYDCDTGDNACKLANGRQCTDGAQCAGGICIDGYCCNGMCDQACETCNQAGNEGKCTAVSKGLPDPRAKCQAQAASTCLTDGTCAGNRGECGVWGADTVCAGADCSADGLAAYGQRKCDGQGTCAAASQTACSPYLCDAATKLCLVSCRNSGDCAPGSECVIPVGQTSGACKLAAGKTCSADADCASGFCTDGVCCNEKCDQACEKCSLAGKAGTCSAVAAGFSDPRGKCDVEDKATCGRDGKCSGTRGVCRKWDVNTVCENPKCVDSNRKLQPARKCDGNGNCLAATPAACLPYTCDPSQAEAACRLLCFDNVECIPPYGCDMDDFKCKLTDGQPCQAGGDCISGFCADGVCCDEQCGGACQLCNQAGSVGACSAVAANVVDPRGICSDMGAASCLQTGLCSGVKGVCQLYASGTLCEDFKCTVDLAESYGQRRCTGNGICPPAIMTACAPYACSTATGVCNTACAADADCAPNAKCFTPPSQANNVPVDAGTPPVAGSCRLVDGRACAADAECFSGFCTDGVCCNEKCDQPCESCDQDQKEGACTELVIWTVDPEAKCPTDDQKTCGFDGYCSGVKGQCHKWIAGTKCLDAVCSGDTANHRHDCDGSGTCAEGGTTDCTPYTCSSGACLAECNSSSDCAVNYACNTTSHVCLLKNGRPCVQDVDCLSNFCTDGVCCESRCNGACENCLLLGVPGRCDPYADGSDPELECPDEGAASCKRDGSCDGNHACRLYAFDTICAAASCSSDTLYVADRCNGTGTCVDMGTLNCTPYTCASGACRTNCAGAADCAANHTCRTSDGVCLKSDGQVCTLGQECHSGFCTDGVCCGTACGGTCESCDQAGRLGHCDPISMDTDPGNECSPQAQSTCGRTGDCGGNRNCKLFTTGTNCLDPACSGDTLNNMHTCDGAGACQEGGTTNCVPFTCRSGACLSQCATSLDCAANYSCNTTTHMCLRNNGQPCSGGGDCYSGFCADNVCCDTACNGTCENCALSGTDGFCTAIPADTDPDKECSDQGAASCKRNGDCDGNRACKLYVSGTVCIQAFCTGDILSFDDKCDGLGSCIDNGTKNCAPYTCSGGKCNTSCAGNADCAANHSCGAANVCLKNNGLACSQAAECFSGKCVDGYCCNSLCNGTCESCGMAGHEGSCDPVPIDTDPEGECPDDGAATCDRNGMCSGQRSCRNYAAGAECVAASCSGDLRVLPDLCDGSGNCVDGGTSTCAPYGCRNGACKNSCNVNGDCAANNSCNILNNTCLLNNGQACSNAALCYSGKCVDGVCCDLICSGLCESCNQTGHEGVCTAIPDGQDPGLECGDLGAAGCGNDGYCDGSKACRNYASGTICAASACIDHDNLQSADTCDGIGHCIDNGSMSCAPYRCLSGACAGSCSVNGDCAAGHTCETSSHTCKKNDGQTCSNDQQCYNGYCTDGVCCNDRCSGKCEKCDISGSAGICSPVPDGADLDNECSDQGPCGQDGFCSGQRSCRQYGASTVCLAASCATGDTLNRAHTCDGIGGCQETGTQFCGGYACDLGACKTSCSGQADCSPSYQCNTVAHECRKNNGLACTLGSECYSGNCVDGFCCNNSCPGTCMACNVSGNEGSCAPVPGGADPGHECNAVSCSGYFDGWGGSNGDICYNKADVADSACNGAGACQSAADVCPFQGRGSAYLNCDDACQAKQASTCTGTTAGVCSNLPGSPVSCGTGKCYRTENSCLNGAPHTCVPGTPDSNETCNNSVDDDCDGIVDNPPGQNNPQCNVCGDGYVDNLETCDDGKTGKGCSSDCATIVCSEAGAWVSVMDGTTCYWRNLSTVSRSSASSACTTRGGYLVRMETAGERDWVFNNMIFPPGAGSRVWVGAQRSVSDGLWYWDGGQIIGLEFIWHAGEPSGEGFCAESSGDGISYGDADCSSNRDYVCERPRPGTAR